jgi:hypothetical protein
VTCRAITRKNKKGGSNASALQIKIGGFNHEKICLHEKDSH